MSAGRRKFQYALACTVMLLSLPAISDPVPWYPMVVGIIQMAGQITAPACQVDTGSASQIINMGAISNTDFDGPGSFARSVPFSLRLVQCSNDTRQLARVRVTGDLNPDNPDLLRTYSDSSAVAMGVGLGLFDADHHLLKPDTPQTAQVRIQDGSTRLNFTARYGQTQAQVTGGEADATAWFTVSYQ